MAYKTHDPARQATSAYFAQGVQDAAEDDMRQMNCPPIPALGKDPDCSWSSMYRQGYEQTRTGEVHICGPNCKKET